MLWRGCPLRHRTDEAVSRPNLPSSQMPARGRTRWTIVFLVVVVALHLTLSWSLRLPGMSWWEDDAQYTVLARQLAHGSYREDWLVDAPIHARYPPGFPLLLAASNVVAPDTFEAHQVVVLLCSTASLLVIFGLANATMGLETAVFATALSAIGISSVLDAGTVMAEAPFQLFLLLSIWFAVRRQPRRRDLLLAGGCAVMAALVRTAGVAMIAALAIEWALQRRWRAVGALALGSLPVAAWILWTAVAPDPGQRGLYMHTIAVAIAHPTQVGPSTTVAARLVRNTWLYARAQFPSAMSFLALKHNLFDNVLWGILLLATVPVGLAVLWRRGRIVALSLAMYMFVLLLWPWSNPRFASPVAPLLLVVIAAGVLALATRLQLAGRRAALLAVALLFVVGAGQAIVPNLLATRACDRQRPVDSTSCLTPDERGLLLAARYVRDSTPSDAVLYVPKEAGFYLRANRRSVRDLAVTRTSADSLGGVLRRLHVTYAAVSPIGASAHRRNRLIAQACREFDYVASFDSNAVLLRVRPIGPLDEDGEACQRTQMWRDGEADR